MIRRMSGNGAAPPDTNLVDLVIISGQSGAGKSSAMNVFEDAGYFCVDNLPAEMIRSLAGLFMHEGSKVERAAVVCDLRGGEYFDKLARVIETLRSDGVAHRLIFLCADDETLLSRYKETRRRHPLAPAGNVIDGIRREAEALAPIRELADSLIDTSGLSASALRRKVANELLEEKSPRRLAVTFGSFGHKHGPPRDADLAFDVRFLPNPHWEPELRPLTGFDTRIVDYVGARRPPARVLRPRDPAARVPAPAVRRGGQGAPRGGDRLHRRAPPLGGDRRAPRIALPFRRSLLHRDAAPGRRSRPDARVSRPLACSPSASNFGGFQGHGRTRGDQRLRPHRTQRLPRRS